ncbi:MAG: aldo/keto reductase [Chloroflexi bacterium]|nr:aldo/keto reductase [Chloroflexota bacterium]
MEKRRLGRTGHMSSVVAFGAAGIGRVDQPTADKAIQTALDYGVNHIDVAPSYGEAELRFHDWMPKIRDRVFLGCKTNIRDAAASWDECQRSLERLNTDRFDLYQLHSVGKKDILDEVTKKGGALETLVKAREQGLTTWLGITGHTHDAPSTHLEALRRFDFDTVMLPLNFVLWSIPRYRRDFEALMEECARRDVGVHVIKTLAKAPWGEREKTYACWYEPFDQQAEIDQAVAFNLAQPIHTMCSTGDVNILPRMLAAAERVQPLQASAREALVATADRYESPFVGRWA